MKIKLIDFIFVSCFAVLSSCEHNEHNNSPVRIGQSVRQTADGGYIVAGSLDGMLSLFRTDEVGNTIWTKSYATDTVGYNSNMGNSVETTTDGGYAVVGSIGSSNFILVKTNALGDSEWVLKFALPDTTWLDGFSVKQTTDGGFMVLGSKFLLGAGQFESNIYLIKTNAAGDTLWTRMLDVGNNWRRAYFDITSDGGYIIYSNEDFYQLGRLVKTDSIGNILWKKDYGYPPSFGDHAVQETNDGGYIFYAAYPESRLVKTNANGDSVWTRSLGYAGQSVHQTADQGYIITGVGPDFYHHSAILTKTDLNGALVWEKSFKSENFYEAYAVIQTADGGYVLTGSLRKDGILLVKVDAAGNLLWIK